MNPDTGKPATNRSAKNGIAYDDWPKLAKDLGHYDMRIAADGTWFHQGSPILKPKLVKLFASVLRREADGAYWLVTPVEKGQIDVDDAPFVLNRMMVRDKQGEREIVLATNVDTDVEIGPEHPMKVVTQPITGEPRPYVLVKEGLWGLVQRSIFYDLVALATERDGRLWLRSNGVEFDLGASV